MGSEWPLESLESLSLHNTSITYGVVKPGSEDLNGVAFVRGGDIVDGKILLDQLRTITNEVSVQYKRTLLKGGELLVSLVGNPGQVAIVPPELKGANIARQVGLLRLRDDIDQNYVKYVLMSPMGRRSLSEYSSGSVQQVINLKDLKRVQIPIPPIAEQKNIVHILGTLDDKIELNHRMNETLEAMAQALFKSWFVDFDPVIDNALAAGNDIPDELKEKAAARQALGGKRKPLPEDIWKLFPDSFEYSEELGWVPAGWAEEQYSTVGELNPESWTKKNAPLSVRYVDLSNTKDGRINQIITYDFAEAPSRARRVLRKNDTIIGTVRPGNRSYAFIHSDGLTGSTGFAVISPKRKIYRSFIYLGLTQKDTIEWFAHLADGAAYPAIRPEVVACQKIALPDDEILENFDSLVSGSINKMGQSESESEILSKLRDTLLPKLLSGELRIPDVEKLIEEAV
jgi:type I restriction enzyme, S subunit